ncbi:hypothetical protein D3C73_814740 [compost metagenome]
MQRLIHVGLRHSNIILESARHRFPQCMDDAQGCIAVFNIIYNNTNRKQIVNLVKLLVLRCHLLIHAVNMLWPS